MKKLLKTLLLGSVALFSGLTANADIYLIGAPGNWNISDNSYPLKETSSGSKIYTGTYDIASGKFQFRFYKSLGNWDSGSLGSQSADNPINISLTNGKYSGSLIDGGKGSWSVSPWTGGEVTMVVNLNNNTVEFSTNAEIEYPETMYVRGASINGQEEWNGDTFPMTKTSEGIFTWSGTRLGSSFKFTEAASGWNDDWNISSNGSALVVGTPYNYVNNASDIAFSPASTYVVNPKVTLNLKEGTLLVEGQAVVGDATVDIRGNFTNWSEGDPLSLTTTDKNIYTGSFDIPAGAAFQVVVSGTWYGNTGENGLLSLELNKPQTVDCGTGYENNFTLANWNGGKIDFSFNLTTLQLTLTATEISLPKQLYLVGAPQGDWNVEESEFILDSTEDGIYTAKFEIPEGKFQFRFYSALGEWDSNSIGSQVEDSPINITLTDGEYSGECLWGKGTWNYPDWNGGTVDMTVNLNNMTVNFVCDEIEKLPEQLYLVGPFNYWGFELDGYTLNPVKDQEGIYTGTFEIGKSLLDGTNEDGSDKYVSGLTFKICKYKNWDVSYGYQGNGVYLYNEPTTFTLTNSNDQGVTNFEVENWLGGEVTFTFDLNNLKLTLDAPKQLPKPDYGNLAQLYLVGNFNSWTLMDEDYVIPLDKETGLYTATFEFPATIGENAEAPNFKIDTYDNWAYVYGAPGSEGGVSSVKVYNNVNGTSSLAQGNNTPSISIANWEGGELTVIVDTKTNTLTLVGPDQSMLLAEQMWLVGPFNNWTVANQDYVLEQTGDNNGIYEGTFKFDKTITYNNNEDENPANFKVAYGLGTEEDAWSETFGQAGGAFPLYSNYDVTTKLVVDGGNWTVSNWAGGELKVTVNLNEGGSITISGSDQPEFVAPGEELYLVGAPQGWDIESDEIVLLYNEDTKLYSAVVEIEDDEFNFILYTDLGDWESNYIGAPATSSDNFEVVLSNNEYTGPISYASKTNWLISDWAAAAVTITVDVEKMTISFTNITPVEDGDSSAVDSLVEEGVVTGIYNLQGVRVDRNKLTKGIYIIDGKKVMVK